jgi:outer membrane protein TolC
MRWKAVCGGLALTLAVTAGCKQTVFVSESDFNNVTDQIVHNLENNPDITCKPITDLVAAPPTVDAPEQPIRYMALAEAISIGLEQGTIGSGGLAGQPLAAQGAIGPLTANSADGIRVLEYNPAQAGANIEASLSKFDAVWNSSMTWNTTDRPVGTSLDTFQASGVGAINQEQAVAKTALVKPLPTGGVAGITFETDYTLTNLPSRVNPAYTPSIQFALEQPLLQGFGVEINQLRNTLPGSTIFPGVFNTTPSQDGILIARVKFDEQRAEFERNVQIQVTNVEAAYWNLYNAYWTLYSREAGLRQAYEAWKNAEQRARAGAIGGAKGDVAQAEAQYQLFRVQRLQALDNVMQQEFNLRALLGLPTQDGKRLVPSDAPTLAEYSPDWDTALQEALALRPELVEARQNLKVSQFNLIAAENNLLPDVRLRSTYDVNGIGNRLDGPQGNNAFRSLASDHFNNWSIGITANVPIGYRSANANVRLAKLQLAQNYEVLKVGELKIKENLHRAYQAVIFNYELIKRQRAERLAYGRRYDAQNQLYLAGKGVTLDVVLEAQRFWAQALSDEYTAITTYNIALAQFEFGKGTILRHDNIAISEGPLPVCVAGRAVEHQRQRSLALELRERESPPAPASLCDGGGCGLSAPPLPPESPVTTAPLPELWKTPGAAPLKDVPELPRSADGSSIPTPKATTPAVPTTTAAPRPLQSPPPAKPIAKDGSFGSLRTDAPPAPPAKPLLNLPPEPIPVDAPPTK